MSNPEIVDLFHAKIVQLQGEISDIVSDFKTATSEVTVADVLREVKNMSKHVDRSANSQHGILIDQLDDQAFVIVACVALFVAFAAYFLCIFIAQTFRNNRCRCAQQPVGLNFIPNTCTL